MKWSNNANGIKMNALIFCVKISRYKVNVKINEKVMVLNNANGIKVIRLVKRLNLAPN